MKCIKLISEGKNQDTGVITRVSDIVAHKKVTGGTHVYVPKSEWKLTFDKKTTVANPVENKTKTKKVKEPKKSDDSKKQQKGKPQKKSDKKKK